GQSVATAAFGTYQAGFAWNGGTNDNVHAGIWSGTSDSWEDLSASLTGLWGATSANAIWSDGSELYVAGTGFNLATARYEALMWSRSIPAPGAAVTLGVASLMVSARRRSWSK